MTVQTFALDQKLSWIEYQREGPFLTVALWKSNDLFSVKDSFSCKSLQSVSIVSPIWADFKMKYSITWILTMIEGELIG